MNNRGAPVRWWLPILAIAMAWALAMVAGCASSGRVPYVSRPDTRRVGGIRISGDVMNGLIMGYRTAYPNETSFCLRGELSDTLVEGESWLLATVDDFLPAVYDSVDATHVYYPRFLPGGCDDKRTIALSHDHHTVSGVCTHSHDDANVLFLNRRVLFSIVFCADGRMETLYQDGRRAQDSWLP